MNQFTESKVEYSKTIIRNFVDNYAKIELSSLAPNEPIQEYTPREVTRKINGERTYKIYNLFRKQVFTKNAAGKKQIKEE